MEVEAAVPSKLMRRPQLPKKVKPTIDPMDMGAAVLSKPVEKHHLLKKESPMDCNAKLALKSVQKPCR